MEWCVRSRPDEFKADLRRITRNDKLEIDKDTYTYRF